MSLHLDDCEHCACATYLHGYTKETAIQALESGELGCDNCIDQQGEDGDGHIGCVALFDGDGNVLWDGRHKTRRRSHAARGDKR